MFVYNYLDAPGDIHDWLKNVGDYDHILIKRQVALNDTFVSLEVFMRTDTRAT
jgi:hypothetical protein